MEPISSEEATPNARLLKLLDDLTPKKLFYRMAADKGQWVFWSQEALSNWVIQERIVTALCSCRVYLPGDTLIQFWAAEMIGGRHHLTTTLQPFCLNYLTNENIIKYRKICLGSNLVVADDKNIMDGGIIGRVFRNQLPEASFDLSFYSVAEYPQLELALSCGFNFILVLPVLEPSEKCCVGVLEILSTATINHYAHHLVHTINTMFKSAHLETIDAVQIRTQIRGVYSGVEEREIEVAAKAVCKTHNITLAFLWVRCAHREESEISDYNVNCKGELLVLIPGMLFSSSNYVPDQYYASLGIPMNVGQGLVGKAALYRKPFFCRDVSQLSITQFPFVHCARRLRLKGCFAVCLRTISTRNHEYVVEFFLPRKGTYMRDHHKFLSSILTTMKQHLKTFEAVTQDLGNGFFIEVDNFSIHKEFETLKKFPIVNAQLENESLCSRKDLKQHFGTKLKDDAESVGDNRSTVKRWCGEHNINKWSSSKRSKVCSSSSSPQQTNVVSRGNTESISQATRREPLCSETSTNVALMPVTSMITIKVPYGNLFIAFKLSYWSRMADLVEKVVIKTGLAKGTFCMAYLDEENDPILVASDEDLQDCMNTLRLSGKTTIRMQIESIADKCS